MRASTESLDDYWNRFNDLVHQIQRCPGHELFISDVTIRKRFLTTLGREFSKLADDEKNLCLEPTLLTLDDDLLLSRLRSIQSNHAADPSATVSSYGYSNALKTSNSSSKTAESPLTYDHLMMKESYEALIKQQAEALKEYATAHQSGPASRNNRRPPTAYCYTHGDCHHTGADCNNPRHSPDKNAATLENRMGGSKKGMRKE